MANNDDIKQAAFTLFATKGYNCTSMQDIAEEVGLKKQSLYSHFAGKQELYSLIMHEQSNIIITQLHIAVDSLENEPAEVLFKGIFKCMTELFSCRERLLFWKRGFMVHGGNETSAVIARPDWHFDSRLWDRIYNIVKIKYDKLRRPESFRMFCLSLVLSMQGYFDWMIDFEHNEDMFESFWNNIWHGIHGFID